MSSTSTTVPSSSQILVVGGGPAGSYAASCLAREGFEVTLLEAAKFPRYHIGESLLPSIRPYLNFIDAEELVASKGYTYKPGAAVKLNQYKGEGYADFTSLNGAYNVLRSDFDDVLLRHSADCGVNVIEETKVTEFVFDGARPIAALYKGANGTEGRINFEYLVDASGRNGLMSVKYLKNRRFNSSLKNIAVWGYWTNTSKYRPGTERDNAVWIEALDDESGWAWFIPMAGGIVSVGVVVDKDNAAAKRKGYDIADPDEKNFAFYKDELKRSPGTMKLLEGAKMKIEEGEKPVKTTSDFSYDANTYGGDHYRMCGDAAAFIDPFFSSGVHLAMTGGLSAAITIASSIRGTVTEDKAVEWHTSKIGTAYTRFLIVVLGTYKQMRNQKIDIMADVNEDNFDRAFDILKPIIAGAADVGKERTVDDVEKTMDFVRHFFVPTDPDAQKGVTERLDPELLKPTGKMLSADEIAKLVDPNDVEARHALEKANARKPINAMYKPKQNFANEVLHGMAANVERGNLGLITVE